MRKERDNLGKEIDGNKSTLRRVRREREEAKDGVEKGKKEIDSLIQEMKFFRKQHNENCYDQHARGENR